MERASLRERIETVRRFNRAYTRHIGVLEEQFLQTLFSLTEARVLYELDESRATAKQIGETLGLDAGYLSRILDRFERAKLITRDVSADDRRQSFISLTREGRAAFAPLEKRSRAQVGEMLKRLPEADQSRMIGAMTTVAALSGVARNETPQIVLRTHQPGDMGWIVMRHGALYAEEYGYGPQFEAMVAEICAQFLENYLPKNERCWIAEVDGVPVGSVCLVRASTKVAKLRLMFVEPWTRGQGVGAKLVGESISFAKKAGYDKITLWTQSELLAARRLYERAGFKLVAREKHKSFGKWLTGETWELPLR